MTKTSKRLDSNQVNLDFDTPIEAYTRLRDEILNAPNPTCTVESYEEIAIELSAVLKSTIRETGMSREQVVDAINRFFDRSTSDKRKCLTLAMLNNYLSKPTQYPIPGIIILAIQHVCHSLKPIGYFAELEGGKVITRQETRELGMGKLDNAIREMQKMKRELLGGKTR